MEKLNKYIRSISIIGCIILASHLYSCKKFLEVDTPITKVSTESAFNDDASATAVLTGIYAQLINGPISGHTLVATSYYEELSADNLVLKDIPAHAFLAGFYRNELEPTYSSTGNQQYWTSTYKLIYTINSSIIGLSGNEKMSKHVAERLLGEAYFLRAFCYFYLVNLYGEVPLILSTEYVQNSTVARSSVSNVYNQIVDDLNKAESLLDNRYLGTDITKTTLERVRPNLAAVNALQARVQLYLKNYDAAEIAAEKVISQSETYSFTDLNRTFVKNSTETIWALQPVQNNYNTPEAYVYLLPADGPDYDRTVYMSNSLVDDFEPGDDRRNKWVAEVEIGTDIYRYPAKYKVGQVFGSTTFDEYSIVLRLAEQYLIRAEARNEQGNVSGAISDLNALRTRSRASKTDKVPNPLPNLGSDLSQIQLRALIQKERRVELFAEWGHRWFDLKRSGNLDATMTEAEKFKGGKWESYKTLYPIPVSDILLNSKISQNSGYSN